MDDQQTPRSFGVFKPTGHVVISFPTAVHADLAAQKRQAIGLGEDAVLRYTDTEMLRQIDIDRQHAGVLASLGQELNLVLAHRALAERGYHWLVVRARPTMTWRARWPTWHAAAAPNGPRPMATSSSRR